MFLSYIGVISELGRLNVHQAPNRMHSSEKSQELKISDWLICTPFHNYCAFNLNLFQRWSGEERALAEKVLRVWYREQVPGKYNGTLTEIMKRRSNVKGTQPLAGIMCLKFGNSSYLILPHRLSVPYLPGFCSSPLPIIWRVNWRLWSMVISPRFASLPVVDILAAFETSPRAFSFCFFLSWSSRLRTCMKLPQRSPDFRPWYCELNGSWTLLPSTCTVHYYILVRGDETITRSQVRGKIEEWWSQGDGHVLEKACEDLILLACLPGYSLFSKLPTTSLWSLQISFHPFGLKVWIQYTLHLPRLQIYSKMRASRLSKKSRLRDGTVQVVILPFTSCTSHHNHCAPQTTFHVIPHLIDSILITKETRE